MGFLTTITFRNDDASNLEKIHPDFATLLNGMQMDKKRFPKLGNIDVIPQQPIHADTPALYFSFGNTCRPLTNLEVWDEDSLSKLEHYMAWKMENIKKIKKNKEQQNIFKDEQFFIECTNVSSLDELIQLFNKLTNIAYNENELIISPENFEMFTKLTGILKAKFIEFA